MCRCALKASLATFPARSIIRAKPAVVTGPPRSEVRRMVILAPALAAAAAGRLIRPEYGMRARGALLDPADVQACGPEVQLIPTAGPQTRKLIGSAGSQEHHVGVSLLTLAAQLRDRPTASLGPAATERSLAPQEGYQERHPGKGDRSRPACPSINRRQGSRPREPAS
jgi:hypothetical protein